ncbi:MAG: 2-phosphosulfolactate phosphatase [Bacteroidetes bacterium]|nr:MAG: 2-phosphosulfolactate phosphatase [Bacteroidota bacterium]
MKKIEVCLSPELIHLFELEGKTVVVVDILRATSCMTTAFAYNIQSMKPVASLDECKALKQEGYFIAAERGGEKVKGFDIGNSPFSYMEPTLKGEKVAVTTTNGTLAITKSMAASHILIGSFLNIKAIAEKVKELDQDLIIHCAGWKGSVNAEDTLFAGALIELLIGDYEMGSDDATVAYALYQQHKGDMLAYVSQSSHAQRLKAFGIMKDIEFCLESDMYDVVPYLKDGSIVS